MIADFVKSYGLAKAQSLLTLHLALEQEGYTMDDLEAFVEAKRKALKKKERIRTIPFRKCECGGQMVLLPVNTGSGNQTGDDSKHVWFCNACLHQEFTTKTFNQIISEAYKSED